MLWYPVAREGVLHQSLPVQGLNHLAKNGLNTLISRKLTDVQRARPWLADHSAQCSSVENCEVRFNVRD